MEKKLATITREKFELLKNSAEKENYGEILLWNLLVHILGIYRYEFDSVSELRKYAQQHYFLAADTIAIGDVKRGEMKKDPESNGYIVYLKDTDNDNTFRVCAWRSKDNNGYGLMEKDWNELLASSHNTRAQVYMKYKYTFDIDKESNFYFVSYSINNDPPEREKPHSPLSDITIEDILNRFKPVPVPKKLEKVEVK